MLCKAELIYGLFHMHLESRPRGFNLLGIISYTFLFDLRCSDVVEVDLRNYCASFSAVDSCERLGFLVERILLLSTIVSSTNVSILCIRFL